MQIGELEGEVVYLKQQLSQATDQRHTLLRQLETINSKLIVMETKMNREMAKYREAQVCGDSYEQSREMTSMKGWPSVAEDNIISITNYFPATITISVIDCFRYSRG